jgi:hypothetical protein
MVPAGAGLAVTAGRGTGKNTVHTQELVIFGWEIKNVVKGLFQP